jgi:hypothetical protein
MTLADFYKHLATHLRDLYGLDIEDIDAREAENAWLEGQNPYNYTLWLGEKFNLEKLT